jgi:UDP-N-acetylglucosamine 1-carboxyvinyltransferase
LVYCRSMNIRVQGGQVLSGEIYPSGSKNSAVALIPASILINGKTVLENIPDITDVVRLIKIMEKLGSLIVWDKEKKTLSLDNSDLSLANLTQEDLGSMRGTSLLWGPLLARFRKASFDELPGGCTLGSRPLDAHYEAFRSLEVKIVETDRGVHMDADHAKPSEIWLTEMSVTATENAIMLATSLKGKTRIVGGASEPQVQDLCVFLNKAGAKISGIGSSVIEIEGGQDLKPISHRILSDHYEVGTFLALMAATGGHGKVHDANPELMKIIDHEFSKFGIKIQYEGNTAIIPAAQKVIVPNGKIMLVRSQPWPALPVDMLPLFIPLALQSHGQVMFHNWMYESGLFWTSELTKLGANVVMCDPHRVIVTGGNKLIGAKLEAPYIIRAVVAMTMSAMLADGETTILNADALYRGHPDFAQNLRKLGAKIEEIE